MFALTGVQATLEFPHIARHALPVHSDPAPAARDQHLVAQAPPQIAQRLPEGAPGARLVGLGPEHPHQRVPTLQAAGLRQRQHGEEGQPLGLGHHRAGIGGLGALDEDGAEASESDHDPWPIVT